MKNINITERVNFTFSLSSKHKGELEDRIHNLLISYYCYTIKGGYITINAMLPTNADFIIQLVNGIEA